MLTLSTALALYGITTGLSGPIVAYITDVSPEDKLEISMGLYRTINDVGYVLGPLLLGFIADLTATPVEGASHSGLIGIVPFVTASVVLMIAFLFLLKADDPSRTRTETGK
jgi:MFS family permease